MVYCGKPAKSCRQCRQRNIKCDKKTPACGQCHRANLTCPGYHNPANLVFRDETEAVIQKVYARDYHLLLSTIHPPIEMRAKKLFITHHVLGDSPTLQFLPSFYPPSSFDLALPHAAKAVMFAYLFAEVSSCSTLQTARKAYSDALIETNKNLRSPETATKNCTLLTVLLLDLFEKFTSWAQGCVEAEAKHLQGAIALLKLRGSHQFQDPIGMDLFHHLSSRLLYDCLKHGFEVPTDFITLRKQASLFVHEQDHEWSLSDIVLRLIDLRDGLRQGVVSPFEVLTIAHQLRDESLRLKKEFNLVADGVAEEMRDRREDVSIKRDLHFLLIQSVLDKITQECSRSSTEWEIPTRDQITALDICG